MAETTIFGVSAVARRLGVSEDTVRRWDSASCIKAARDSAGRRVFTPEQIEKLRQFVGRTRAA